MKYVLSILCLFLGNLLNAQTLYRGFVYDSTFKTALNPVRIENLTTHDGTYTNDIGYFQIEAKPSDHIIFSMVGYKNQVIIATENNSAQYITIYMKPATVMLKNIVIKKGPTQYQLDSARRLIFTKMFLNTNNKNQWPLLLLLLMKNFQKSIKIFASLKIKLSIWRSKIFIDSRYSKELVISLTKLNEEEAQTFMNANPMEYDFARAATDLEIKMWIKYNFSQYIKDKK
ncbi:MAG: hypothetical protein UZ11_BCD004001314 [Bacteroidetes bacterium OLB11]|nr:MAG: hypothetical protein UZ11_BCD004001314 [Bacteroidetes bacterium OLB11]